MTPLYNLVPSRVRGHEAFGQFVRYALIGCFNVVVYLAIFNTMQLIAVAEAGVEPTRLQILGASAVAFTVTSLISFVLNKLWAFRDTRREKVVRQYGVFFFFTLVGLVLHEITLFLLLIPLQQYGLIGRNAAALCALPVSILWNFNAYRRWTFNVDRAPVPVGSVEA